MYDDSRFMLDKEKKKIYLMSLGEDKKVQGTIL